MIQQPDLPLGLPPPPRPMELTPEALLKVAGQMVDRLIKAGHFEEEHRDGSRDNLIAIGHSVKDHDGYQIAKELDKRFGWDCGLDLANDLDQWGYYYGKELLLEQARWVEQYAIKPTLPMETRIKTAMGKLGTITGVSTTRPACYEVRLDEWGPDATNPPRRPRMMLAFERAIPLEEHHHAA